MCCMRTRRWERFGEFVKFCEELLVLCVMGFVVILVGPACGQSQRWFGRLMVGTLR